MKEKKKSTGVWGRIRDRIGREAGTWLGEPRVELCGRGRLCVDGAKKIGFCSPERVLVILGKGSLTVSGSGLICLSFQNETLIVGGRVSAVSFGEGEGT